MQKLLEVSLALTELDGDSIIRSQPIVTKGITTTGGSVVSMNTDDCRKLLGCLFKSVKLMKIACYPILQFKDKVKNYRFKTKLICCFELLVLINLQLCQYRIKNTHR